MYWVKCIGAAIALGVCAHAQAAVILASDNASDAAYASGWGPGTNGGTGWGGAWSFKDTANATIATTNGNRGWFISNSINNDNTAGDTNADGDINTPVNRAWGLYSNAANNDIYAVRPFASALQVGQTFSFDMDNGNIATNQVVGLRLISDNNDPLNSRVWEWRFVGGASAYSIISNPNITSTMTFTREGVHVDFTLTSATTFSVTATKLVDGTTYSTTGTLANSNAILGLAMKNQQAGSGATADAFFNSITVSTVPEPASLSLLAAGMLLGRRRRN